MGSWQAKVYINDIKLSAIKVKNDTKLEEIKESLNPLLPKGLKYYFLNNLNDIIRIEKNYAAEDIWKNDEIEENGYRIDIVTADYYYSAGELVNLYVNDFKTSSIRLKKSMNLKKIKSLGGDEINKSSLFFLDKNNIIIKDTKNKRLDDVIVEKNGEKKINFVDDKYYMRVQVIEHLKILETSTTPINWLEQQTFFTKVENLAGKDATIGIIDGIFQNIFKNTGKKINDKIFIKRFLMLLTQNERSSITTNFSDF